MLRLLLSLPVSLAMVFALFSAMAWMVNLGKLNGVTPSAPVSFNMVMFEAQSEVARRQRAVPPPPDVPPPPQPEVMKVSQTPMTTTSAQVEMPNVDMSFSVSLKSSSVNVYIVLNLSTSSSYTCFFIILSFIGEFLSKYESFHMA